MRLCFFDVQALFLLLYASTFNTLSSAALARLLESGKTLGGNKAEEEDGGNDCIKEN